MKRKTWRDLFRLLRDEDAQFLNRVATNKEVLEIGAFKGGSTVAMAETAISITTIDTFKGDFNEPQKQRKELTTLEEFKNNIQGYTNIKYYIGTSLEIVPNLINNAYDIAFIDGLHTFEAVFADINLCWPKVKQGGLFIFHDCPNPGHLGVEEAVQKYFGKQYFRSSELISFAIKG